MPDVIPISEQIWVQLRRPLYSHMEKYLWHQLRGGGQVATPLNRALMDGTMRQLEQRTFILDRILWEVTFND